MVGLTGPVGLVLLFLDSTFMLLLRELRGGGWVEHRVWFMVFRISVRGFGTLLGPEGTLVGVSSLASGLDRLTHPLLVGVVVVVVGWGVVVC